MIKDISIIREHLIGYAEVEMPYDFPINCHIKYITFTDNEESFNAGGKFCRKLNDFIILKNNGPSWRVPICMRNKTGEIIYETLHNASKVLLDCKNHQIIVLEHKKHDEYIEQKKIYKSLGYIK